jgi:hypothetical protein
LTLDGLGDRWRDRFRYVGFAASHMRRIRSNSDFN